MTHYTITLKFIVLCLDILLKAHIKIRNLSSLYMQNFYFNFKGTQSMSSLQKFSAGVQLQLYPKEPTRKFTCLQRIKPIKLSKFISRPVSRRKFHLQPNPPEYNINGYNKAGFTLENFTLIALESLDAFFSVCFLFVPLF